MRQQKFKYYWQHDGTGRIVSKIFTIDDIESGRMKHYVTHDLGLSYGQHIGRSELAMLVDGTEFYEDDILEYADTSICIIEWDDTEAAYCLDVQKGTSYQERWELCELAQKRFKIVGNKYEH